VCSTRFPSDSSTARHRALEIVHYGEVVRESNVETAIILCRRMAL
jgi:hypothetical protein